MIIKYSATPKPERRKGKDGNVIVDNVPLLIDIAYGGNRFFITSGFRVNIAKWDSVTMKAMPNTIHPKKAKAKKINDGITGLLSDIDDRFKEFELKDWMPSVQEFKNALKPTLSIEESKQENDVEWNIFESFDLYVEQNTAKWQPNTVKKHTTTKKHLYSFDNELTFEKLDNAETLDAFTAFMNKKGLRNTSAEKYLKVLKWFLKWAVAKNHTQFKGFLSFKPSLENIPKEIIFLTQPEFRHLFKLKLEADYLARVRDIFCFSCVTGLRFSDIQNLKRSQIKNQAIHLTTVKTNQRLVIPFNKYSKAILDKYRSIEYKDDKALPVISNQKSNEYLKEVCKKAKFNEPIEISYKVGNQRKNEIFPKYTLMSMHAGRRTFVCLGLFLGMTPKVIMSITGHSSMEAMKPYEKIIDELKNKEMKKFNF